jgi:hypothetical protein
MNCLPVSIPWAVRDVHWFAREASRPSGATGPNDRRRDQKQLVSNFRLSFRLGIPNGQHMNSRAYKLKSQTGGGQSASRVLLISATFVAVLVVAWLIGRNLVTPMTIDPAEKYRGVIQLPPTERGGCEQFELDNRSGMMKSKGFTECSDIAPTQPSQSYGPGSLGRLSGIADHFKSR